MKQSQRVGILWAISLVLGISSAFAGAEPGEGYPDGIVPETPRHLVLELSDVDYEIKTIQLYTCNIEPWVISDCADTIVVRDRKGVEYRKVISWPAANTFHEYRYRFSSSRQDSFVTQIRTGVCLKAPPHQHPVLKAIFIHYLNNNTPENAVTFVPILGDDDCTRSSFLRPKSDEGLAQAQAARRLLKILAAEITSPHAVLTARAQ